MKSLKTWFKEYGESHRNRANKILHWVCVPLIFFSIVGLLASINCNGLKELFPEQIQPFVHWGSIGLIITLLFYIRLSFTMFLGMFLVSFASVYGNYLITNMGIAPLWQISLIIFVAAWVGQFVGHKIEGKKPSFFKDIQYLLIGPAWVIGFIYRELGIKY